MHFLPTPAPDTLLAPPAPDALLTPFCHLSFVSLKGLGASEGPPEVSEHGPRRSGADSSGQSPGREPQGRGGNPTT